MLKKLKKNENHENQQISCEILLILDKLDFLWCVLGVRTWKNMLGKDWNCLGNEQKIKEHATQLISYGIDMFPGHTYMLLGDTYVFLGHT